MTRHTLRIALGLSLFAPLTPGQAPKPDDAITIGRKHTLHSDILDEDRTVWVSVPPSYSSGTRSYPVLYLLDGSAHFHHTTGIVDFLAQNERMPETIVVGITNTDRTRDLTPHPGNAEQRAEVKGGGGADAFLRFLTTELEAWVESSYRTKPVRILIGHSFGGLFGIHALVQKPDFFRGIIAISPSMQWGDQELVGRVETWLKSKPATQCAVYMAAGNEGGGLLGGTLKVAGLFSEMAPPSLRWKFEHMPMETHGSVPHRATYDGLEFLFDGWWVKDAATAYDAGGWAGTKQRLVAARKRMGLGDEPVSPLVFGGMVFGLVSANRYDDVLAALSESNAERDALPAGFWTAIPGFVAQSGATEVAKQLYHIGVGLHPENDEIRELAVAAGCDPSTFPPKPALVEVPAPRLAACTGSYRGEGPVRDLVISHADGMLWLGVGKRDPSPLTTKSADVFVDPQGAELRFGPTEDGIVRTITISIGGHRFSYGRVDGEVRRPK